MLVTIYHLTEERPYTTGQSARNQKTTIRICGAQHKTNEKQSTKSKNNKNENRELAKTSLERTTRFTNRNDAFERTSTWRFAAHTQTTR